MTLKHLLVAGATLTIALPLPAMAQLAGANGEPAREHVELLSYSDNATGKSSASLCGLDRDDSTNAYRGFQRVLRGKDVKTVTDWNQIVPANKSLIITDVEWDLSSFGGSSVAPGQMLELQLDTRSNIYSGYNIMHQFEAADNATAYRSSLSGSRQLTTGMLINNGQELCLFSRLWKAPSSNNSQARIQDGGMDDAVLTMRMNGYLVDKTVPTFCNTGKIDCTKLPGLKVDTPNDGDITKPDVPGSRPEPVKFPNLGDE